MDLDNDEVKATRSISDKKYKNLEKAVKITENLDEYLVPGTSMHWAVKELRNFVKESGINDNS